MSRSIIRALFALALLLAALLLGVDGQPPPVWGVELLIEAPRFTYDQDADLYTYEDGRLELGGLTLFANEMELQADTGTVRASGFIRLETGGLSGTGEALVLDVESRVVRFTNAAMYSEASGAYLAAEEIVIHPSGRLELRQCTVTACPPRSFGSWKLTASSLEVIPDQIAIAWNPTLYIGSIPVLWVPGVAGPAVLERRSGLLAPELEQDSSSLPRYDLGLRFRVPFFLNLGFDHDLTITPEYIRNRGNALGLEYNYAFRENQTGQILLWGIDERDPRRLEEENDILTPLGLTEPPEPPRRYRIDWAHNQRRADGGRVILSYHHSSDGQLQREYEGVGEYRPYRTYQASFTNQWEWVDAALTWEQNADYLDESVYADSAEFTDQKSRPQRLPRFSTQIGGRIWGPLPLSLNLGLSATRYVAEAAVGGRLYTVSPTLSAPISLGGAFELRPSLTRHFVSYRDVFQFAGTDAETQLADESFAQSEGTLELRTTVSRVYAAEASRFAAYKHRIIPRLIAHAVEDVPQPFADDVRRGRVAERLLTFRLDNVLLGRPHRGVESRSAQEGPPSPGAPVLDPPVQELLRVNLIQRYNRLRRADAKPLTGPGFDRAQETEDGDPALPLVLEIFAGTGAYTASALVNYHHQLSRTTRTELSVTGTLSERMRLGFSYTFNEFEFLTPDNKVTPAANALSFDGEMAWSDYLSLGFGGRLNLQEEPPPLDRRLDRSEVFVDFHPACYDVRLTYTESVASTVIGGAESFYVDRGVKLSFSLSGLRAPAAKAVQSVQAAQTGARRPSYASTKSPARCHG